jgi:AcrR family transcriptional regulator
VTADPEPEHSAAGPAAARRRIIESAAIEFRLNGLEGTTMADIAKRAGIRRSNLYRYVDSKQELLAQVLIQQVQAVHAERRQAPPFHGPVGPLIVAALEQEHDLARDDELLQVARSAEIEPHTAHLLRTDDELFRTTANFWAPILAYGRSRAEVRDDVTDHDIIRWFFLVQYMLIINESIFHDRDEIKHYLRRMVGAAILRDPTSV